MSTVFPDADPPLAEPLADDEELLEQPAASVTIATAAMAGASFLPFKIRVLSLTCLIRLPGSEEMPVRCVNSGGNVKRVAPRDYRSPGRCGPASVMYIREPPIVAVLRP